MQFHVSKTRCARLAGVHRKTMEHLAKEAAGAEFANITRTAPVYKE